MKNLIKKIFKIQDPIKTDYSVFNLTNLVIYFQLHETITGEKIKVLKLSSKNYLTYWDFLMGNSLWFRGTPVKTNLTIKSKK